MRLPTRTVASAGALVLGAAASTFFVVAPASATPAADATFATMNEQSNLAEISLGTLAKSKGQDAGTRELATKTLSDHMTAKAKLTAVATSATLTLPTTPNAVQLTVAAQLKAASTSSFDLMYAQAQVTAHQQALAAARTEESTTTDAKLKSYTSYYIGIATMHLNMARAEVSKLGGTPTTVQAGTGGAASTSSSVDTAGVWGIGAGAVLLVAGGALALTRRRATSSL